MMHGKNTTLLDLMWSITQSGAHERAVVAAIMALINRGQVQLCGPFAGARIEETAPSNVASPTLPTPRTRRKRDV
jgi:hypothetical protein